MDEHTIAILREMTQLIGPYVDSDSQLHLQADAGEGSLLTEQWQRLASHGGQPSATQIEESMHFCFNVGRRTGENEVAAKVSALVEKWLNELENGDSE